MPALELRKISKTFGNFIANDQISLVVEPGEIHCVVGENGAGKSTLMNIVYGLLQADSGDLLIQGRVCHFKSPREAIAAGLGMVHQHFKLVPGLTIYENVLLGSELCRGPLAWIDQKQEQCVVQELIDQYHFQLDARTKVCELSVGEQQRVEILKLLYQKSQILILDEPTAVLTPQEIRQLFEQLRRLAREGRSIVLITHKLQEVMAVGDRVSVIKRGKLMLTTEVQDSSEEELAREMIGRDLGLALCNSHQSCSQAKELLSIRGLSLCSPMGDRQILDQISFSVSAGEIVGIAGVEGNGQSELVKILSGLMSYRQGEIRIKGQVLDHNWPRNIRQKGMAIIPEDRYVHGLCRELSASENLLAAYPYHPDFHCFGFLRRKRVCAACRELMDQYDVRAGSADGHVGQLSGGNAQKLVIARELSRDTDLLIACQPTRGVDIGAVRSIHQRLLAYREAGKGILLISSELTEITALSDRILVMCRGRIAGELQAEEVDAEVLGMLMAGSSQVD